MKYAWIHENRGSFPVSAMCEVLEVSRSGYYDSLTREQSPRVQRHEKIRQAVLQVHQESNAIYGSKKIAQELRRRPDLEQACRNTVAHAMRELGLCSRIRKSFTPTTTQADPTKQPAPNILNQDFVASAPNQKWVTDITYIWTAIGWIYLAVVMDLYGRKIVGWAVSQSLHTDVVQDALRAAVQARQPDAHQLLLHSDRGCQYTSDAFQEKLKLLGITCSMSRTGCCYDNAVMERFFWSLKNEWTNHETFADIEEARLSIFKYIETFYNSIRIHQALGYLTPKEFEADHAPAQAA